MRRIFVVLVLWLVCVPGAALADTALNDKATKLEAFYNRHLAVQFVEDRVTGKLALKRGYSVATVMDYIPHLVFELDQLAIAKEGTLAFTKAQSLLVKVRRIEALVCKGRQGCRLLF